MKSTYEVVHTLMNQSGFAWSPDTGAGVTADSPAEVKSVWDAYTAVRISFY